MEMTPLQLASEYRTGKDKTKTIKVLAELNAVTQRRIAEILVEQGEELPGHWKEKLATPPKRPPKERPMTAGELSAEIAKAIQTAIPSAEELRQESAALLPVPAPAALSLDEIRQAALELILTRSPGEAVRFQGYALGVAALADALREKLEGRT